MHRIAVAAFVLTLAASASAQGLSGRKVLYVNSYHPGYAWSDGEEAGAKKVLAGSGVRVDFVRLDAKRQPEEKIRKEQEQKLRALIEAEKPDVVIAADDDAAQAMLAYKNAPLKWVFCGINWDAAKYGLPFSNTTGMVEVTLPDPIIENLKGHAKGQRVAFLTADNDGQRADGAEYRRRLGSRLVAERYVKTFADWKEAYRTVQGEADIVLVGNFVGIKGWDEAQATAWVAENVRLPTGTFQEFMMPYAMLGMTKVAEEQGIWAAKAAVNILKGASPNSIPVAMNKEAKLWLNVGLASKVGIVFKPELLKNAQIVR